MPSGNKPLPEPMPAQILTIWSLGHSELITWSLSKKHRTGLRKNYYSLSAAIVNHACVDIQSSPWWQAEGSAYTYDKHFCPCCHFAQWYCCFSGGELTYLTTCQYKGLVVSSILFVLTFWRIPNICCSYDPILDLPCYRNLGPLILRWFNHSMDN